MFDVLSNVAGILAADGAGVIDVSTVDFTPITTTATALGEKAMPVIITISGIVVGLSLLKKFIKKLAG